MLLFIITNIFGLLIQFFLLFKEKSIFPIEHSCVIVYFFIAVLELGLCIFTSYYIGERQSALYYLRNSQISILNQREKIKTSHEIEQELFYKFPYLRKGNQNKNQNIEHDKTD